MIKQKIGDNLFISLFNRIKMSFLRIVLGSLRVLLKVEPDWNMDEEVLTENHRAATAQLLSIKLLANLRKCAVKEQPGDGWLPSP